MKRLLRHVTQVNTINLTLITLRQIEIERKKNLFARTYINIYKWVAAG